MDSSLLQNVPDEYKDIYVRNWKTIRPSVKKGMIKDVYHYPLVSINNTEIVSKLQETLTNYRNKIKINVAFGFI